MTIDYDDLDDDVLRHCYEQELETLRRDMRAFAERNPQATARLSINGDGRSDDPGVERLVQSTALLNARHRAKIDDDYPELSVAIIQRSYPQYLRPFPSSSIAQFDPGSMFNSSTEPVRFARGTPLETSVGQFPFRTAYDVVLAPLRIAQAQYFRTPTIPTSVTVPHDVSGMLSVSFRSAKIGGHLDAATVATLRVYLMGEPAMVAALTDTMLLRATSAYVENGDGHWIRLSDIPLKPVGWGLRDWLVTDHEEPGQAFGQLGEYFAFPQRFHFVDIDLESLCAAAPGDRLTLHLLVTGTTSSSRMAEQLTHFCADHLRLFCTPVVNLFRKEGVSLKCDRKSSAWPISIESKNDAPAEVWAVERVCTDKGEGLLSSDALMAGHASKAHPRWTFVHLPRPTPSAPTQASVLRLASADGPVESKGVSEALLVDLTCSNGDLPRSIPIGARNGDMRMQGNAQTAKKISLLHAPTSVARLARKNGALWRLIGQQATHAMNLNQFGLPALKQVLQQFAELSPQKARHIDGIRGLRHRPVMALMARGPQPAMERGIEVTLEIDDQSFVAHSVAVFAGVMARYFAPYATANSFVQLVVASTSGAILCRCEPRRGAGPRL
ncbi:type VI secretion system baseplate subunit TssF [Trinickia sp. NRRL B-1857]|uniref:type VI secretion system baseplate subunit TssF n=1 Tax=Trinickia sp. NRRL B-1857 TaxID=3162879 RepID=UPI003D27D729